MLNRFILTPLTLLIINCLLIGCDYTDSKTEYAALQGIEYKNKQKHITKVKIIKADGYLVAGFRADNNIENVWVLLDAQHPPYYKQIPQSRFSITFEELAQLKKIPSVSDTVIAVLETRVE